METTLTRPVTLPDVRVTFESESEYAQVMPACVTGKDWPATTISPTRGRAKRLALIE